MADQIRVNGNILSHGSITLKIDGEKFHGFTEVTYGDKLEVVPVYGMNKAHSARAVTRGKYVTQPGKLVGPKTTCEAVRTKLATKSVSGNSYGSVEFEIVIQGVEANELPITHVLEQTRIVGDSSNHAESADPLSDEFETFYRRVRRNGKYLFDSSGGIP